MRTSVCSSLAYAMINIVADRVWNASLTDSKSNESKALEDMISICMAASPFTGFCLTRLLDHLFDKKEFTCLVSSMKKLHTQGSKSRFSKVLWQIIP